jgi:hypothetical protein
MDIFGIFSGLVVMVSSGIVIWGEIRNIKVSKQLKKQDGTKIIRKETSKETLDELKAANRLIFGGCLAIFVTSIIGVLRAM